MVYGADALLNWPVVQVAWPLLFSATGVGQSLVPAPDCVARLNDTLPDVTAVPLQSVTVAVRAVDDPSVAGFGLALTVVQVPVGPAVKPALLPPPEQLSWCARIAPAATPPLFPPPF